MKFRFARAFAVREHRVVIPELGQPLGRHLLLIDLGSQLRALSLQLSRAPILEPGRRRRKQGQRQNQSNPLRSHSSSSRELILEQLADRQGEPS